MPRNAPTGPYLCRMAEGLRESHGMDQPAIADYLASRPGADAWTVDSVLQEIGAAVEG